MSAALSAYSPAVLRLDQYAQTDTSPPQTARRDWVRGFATQLPQYAPVEVSPMLRRPDCWLRWYWYCRRQGYPAARCVALAWDLVRLYHCHCS